jgi:YesN/AraC family two-component response regulator
MDRRRILFVDDEPGIRQTLPPILQAHGFELTPAADVVEALELIQKQKFDVLLTDLNIGHAGDGFTLVSAMRRTQPEAVTIIITGYPAFESALRAIREQVDDYVVKPAEIEGLISVIERKLSHRTPRHVFVVKRVCEILEQHAESIAADWLQRTRQSQELAAASISDQERSGHIPALLSILVRELRDNQISATPEFVESAAQHGIARRRQGASIPMVIEETRILRDAIAGCVQQNLLVVDISTLITDMVRINNILDAQIRESVRAYTQVGPETARGGKKPGRRAGGKQRAA